MSGPGTVDSLTGLICKFDRALVKSHGAARSHEQCKEPPCSFAVRRDTTLPNATRHHLNTACFLPMELPQDSLPGLSASMIQLQL